MPPEEAALTHVAPFSGNVNFEAERDRLRLALMGYTQHYTRVNAHELRGAIKRLRWVG